MITKTKNTKIKKSPEQLERIIADLEKALHQERTELALYKEKYIRLLEEFRLDKKRFFSSSSEKNISQQDLFDEAGVEVSEEIKDRLDTVEIKGYTRKKFSARRALPKDLPREVIVHDIPDSDKICGCGVQLSKIGEETTEQLKYIPAQLSVIQHVRPKYACRPCVRA